MLRIISGRYGGRRIKTLQGMKLRPTSDPLRETLFNILSPRIVGARFVDAYAGSGAVGIEALSRGAAQVTFVERHPAAVACLRANLLALEIETGFSIIERDVRRSLMQVGACDVFFLDPPYAEAREYEEVLSFFSGSTTLTTDILVIAEHSKRHALNERYGALRRVQVKTQGDSQLSFYRL